MNKIGKPTIISEDNEYKDFFLLKNRCGSVTMAVHEDKINDLLILKARRKGFTKSHFTTVTKSIMEQYNFIIIELFPYPSIVTQENGIPSNFVDYKSALEESKELQAPIIIDIKKLQSEKEIDDMAANVGW